MPEALISRRGLLLQALVLILTVMLCSLGLFRYLESRERMALEQSAFESLGLMRFRLESQLSDALAQINSLAAFVRSNPDYSDEQFQLFTDTLLTRAPSLISLGVAPDFHVSHVAPLAGNEPMLGVDYRQLEDQWPGVQQAVVSDAMIVAGPFMLVQGGSGLVARAPVTLASAGSDETVWGIVSAAISDQRLFQQAGLDQLPAGWQLAIRGRDGLGAQGETFLGDARLFAREDALLMPVSVGGGEWQMALGVGAAEGMLLPAPLRSAIWLAALVVLLAGLWLLGWRQLQFDQRQRLQQALVGHAENKVT